MPQQFTMEGLEALFNSYQRALFNTAAHLVGRDAAEDIVQEGIVKFAQAIVAGRIDADHNPKAFLFRIVTNRAINLLRARKSRQQVGLAAIEGMMPIPNEERIINGVVIREALPQLDQQHRFPLVLQYFAGLQTSEIAEILDCSPAAARKRLQRAREALAEILKPPPTADES